MKKAKKALAMLLCAALLVGGTIAGTVAYLTAKTDPVTNTFTAGNVAITLDEAEIVNGVETGDRTDEGNSYHLIPGETYKKDPTVHVAANSENSWIFVKVENGLKNYEAATNTIEAQILAKDWKVLDATNHPGVYYKEYVKQDSIKDLVVFESFTINSNQVLGATWSNVEKANITVTAYAVQSNGVTLDVAWAAAQALNTKA